MTEIAYMVREDWGQHGTTIVPNSKRIRDWLGSPPYAFAVESDSKGKPKPREADTEMISYLAPAQAEAVLATFYELRRFQRDGHQMSQAAVLLHPYKEPECDLLREIAVSGAFDRIFVQIWAPSDRPRIVLDSLGALNLHTGEPAAAIDPVLVEAAKLMVQEEYNTLGTGRGKEITVQLLRLLSAEGYPLDKVVWQQAYFAAGGQARHAETLAKYVTEMNNGVRHRVKQQKGDYLLKLVRERAANPER